MNSTTVSKSISQTVDGVNINVTITTESPDSESAMEVANRIESAVSQAIEVDADE